MPAGLILTIDQGTHSTRAIVFDEHGQAIATARRPVSLAVISHTEIEQSADEIVQSMQTVIAEVLADTAVDRTRIKSAGLATQRSSVVAWNRHTGAALSPVLSWQDRRTEAAISALSAQEQTIEAHTGLHLSPHYGAGKLQWLLQKNTAVQSAMADNTLLMGPLASYLVYHLVQGNPARVDHANASRTLLWNLQTRDWDPHMLTLFGIPQQVLPVCRPTRYPFGKISDYGIPLTTVNGDQTAALYAQGQPPENTLIINIGTGAFVLMPVTDPTERPQGLLAGVSQSDDDSGHYYIEGTVNGAAAALEWASKRFEITDLEQQLPGWLADIEEPTLFINTVGGLGAPWWASGSSPYFLNDTVSAPEALVAVIESIVFLLQANIALMCQHDPALRRVRISGGLSNLDGLCSKLADLSGLEVHRPTQVEATARGIAWQAAGGPRDWSASGAGETFQPQENAKLQTRYQRFIETLKKDLSHRA